MPVSSDKDIKHLFRPVDVDHMTKLDRPLDDYKYMSNATNNYANAQDVLDTLTQQTMPPGGPFWNQDQLDLFKKWMTDGYQP